MNGRSCGKWSVVGVLFAILAASWAFVVWEVVNYRSVAALANAVFMAAFVTGTTVVGLLSVNEVAK